MKKNLLLSVVFVAVVAVLMGNPFYTVREDKQVVITQFGKPVGEAVTTPGLHIKMPFIQKINVFEKRLLEWDGYPNQIPTKDKKYISVDTTARWKIADPLKFFQSVYNEQGAQSRLDDIIDSAVRDAVTAHNLIEIVRSSNKIMDIANNKEKTSAFIEEGVLEEITVGREKIRLEILARAQELAPQYGIELIDVRIKRVNYVKNVRRKVYERMIAERKRAAEQYRSEGRGIRAEIEGRTEKELKGVLSEAYKTAQETKGKADAESTKIYAESYNRDIEFYSFMKTLETYKNTINKDTTIILSTDSEYFRYLKNMHPTK